MIDTNRCRLFEVQDTDLDDIKMLYMNPEVRKFLGGIVDEEVFVEGFKSLIASKGNAYNWCVRLKETNEFIGLVSIDEHHDGKRMEVSYQLLPTYWGKGYATELVQRLIKHAGEELKLTELIAETQTVNKASCKVLLKAGMQFEKRLNRFGAEQNIYHIHTHL